MTLRIVADRTCEIGPDAEAPDPCARKNGSLSPVIEAVPGAVGIVSLRSKRSWLAVTTSALLILGELPPQLLIGMDRRRPSDGLAGGCRFGLGILAGHHSAIAEEFSSARTVDATDLRFRIGENDDGPVLRDAAAALSCVVQDAFDGGAQRLVTASVRAVGAVHAQSALVKWQGDYDRIGWSAAEIARAIGCAGSTAAGDR